LYVRIDRNGALDDRRPFCVPFGPIVASASFLTNGFTFVFGRRDDYGPAKRLPDPRALSSPPYPYRVHPVADNNGSGPYDTCTSADLCPRSSTLRPVEDTRDVQACPTPPPLSCRGDTEPENFPRQQRWLREYTKVRPFAKSPNRRLVLPARIIYTVVAISCTGRPTDRFPNFFFQTLETKIKITAKRYVVYSSDKNTIRSFVFLYSLLRKTSATRNDYWFVRIVFIITRKRFKRTLLTRNDEHENIVALCYYVGGFAGRNYLE